MADFSDIPDGFSVASSGGAAYSDLPQGFSVQTSQPPSFADRVGNTFNAIAPLGLKLGIGAGENALKIGTGTAAQVLGALKGLGTGSAAGFNQSIRDAQNAYTYQPQTQLGMDIERLGNVSEPILGPIMRAPGTAVTALTGNPEYGEATNNAVGLGLTALGARASLRGIAGEARAAAAAPRGSPQSIGAAASAASSAAASASPELQGAVANLIKRGANVNQDVLASKMDAESLGLPPLTEGQVTRDPVVLSNERNMRAANPQYAQHFNQQEKAVADKLVSMRDDVGPQVFSTNPVEHGDTLIKAYQDKAAAADAVVDAKYQALRDALPGGLPLDAKAVLADATARLHKQLLFDHAPPEVMRTLGRLADNNSMTFENFESLRTNRARIMRSQADGNVKAAAGIIRGALEEMPMKNEPNPYSYGGRQSWVQDATQMKALADDARAASRAQFQAVEADPAYKAAVEGTVSPDRFVQRFVINGSRDGVALMRRNLDGNEAATQTMGVAALDYIRQRAGIDNIGNGRLSQANLNKALQQLGPKIPSLLSPQTAGTLEKLGAYARSVQEQPAGSFVNNSNTFTAAAGRTAAKAAEGAMNYAAHGLPVGTALRHVGDKFFTKRGIRNSLAPRAGLDYDQNALKR